MGEVFAILSGFMDEHACLCATKSSEVVRVAAFASWLVPMLNDAAHVFNSQADDPGGTGLQLQIVRLPYFHSASSVWQQLIDVADDDSYTAFVIDKLPGLEPIVLPIPYSPLNNSRLSPPLAFPLQPQLPQLSLHAQPPPPPMQPWSDVALPPPSQAKKAAVVDTVKPALPAPRAHLLMWYRTDALEGMAIDPPATWEDLIAVTEAVDRAITSASDSAAAWPPGSSQPVQHALCLDLGMQCKGGHVLAGMLASLLQYQGTPQGFHFDPRTMTPLVNNAAMSQALDWLRQLAGLNHPLDAASHPCYAVHTDFLQGQCVLTIDWDWAFLLSNTSAAAGLRGNLGVAQLPGAPRVLKDRTAESGGQLLPCESSSECLAAQHELPFQASRGQDLTSNDSALVLVNRAAISAVAHFSGGTPTSTSASSSVAKQQTFKAFFASLDAMAHSYFTAVTLTLSNATADAEYNLQPWLEDGYHERDAMRYFQAVQAADASANQAPLLTVPLASFYRTALDEAVYNVTNGRDVQEIMSCLEQLYAEVQQVYDLWFVDLFGTFEAAYRTSIGFTLPGLPTPAGGSSSSASVVQQAWFAAVIALSGVLLVGTLGFAAYTLYRRRRHTRWQLAAPGVGPETTLLVTDIQNSTMLWESLAADIMDCSVKLHHHCLRTCAIKWGGYESMTEGDSFILAFHTPLDAMSFSMECQLELMYLPWPTELLAHEEACPIWIAHQDHQHLQHNHHPHVSSPGLPPPRSALGRPLALLLSRVSLAVGGQAGHHGSVFPSGDASTRGGTTARGGGGDANLGIVADSSMCDRPEASLSFLSAAQVIATEGNVEGVGGLSSSLAARWSRSSRDACRSPPMSASFAEPLRRIVQSVKDLGSGARRARSAHGAGQSKAAPSGLRASLESDGRSAAARPAVDSVAAVMQFYHSQQPPAAGAVETVARTASMPSMLPQRPAAASQKDSTAGDGAAASAALRHGTSGVDRTSWMAASLTVSPRRGASLRLLTTGASSSSGPGPVAESGGTYFINAGDDEARTPPMQVVPQHASAQRAVPQQQQQQVLHCISIGPGPMAESGGGQDGQAMLQRLTADNLSETRMPLVRTFGDVSSPRAGRSSSSDAVSGSTGHVSGAAYITYESQVLDAGSPRSPQATDPLLATSGTYGGESAPVHSSSGSSTHVGAGVGAVTWLGSTDGGRTSYIKMRPFAKPSRASLNSIVEHHQAPLLEAATAAAASGVPSAVVMKRAQSSDRKSATPRISFQGVPPAPRHVGSGMVTPPASAAVAIQLADAGGGGGWGRGMYDSAPSTTSSDDVAALQGCQQGRAVHSCDGRGDGRDAVDEREQASPSWEKPASQEQQQQQQQRWGMMYTIPSSAMYYTPPALHASTTMHEAGLSGVTSGTRTSLGLRTSKRYKSSTALHADGSSVTITAAANAGAAVADGGRASSTIGERWSRMTIQRPSRQPHLHRQRSSAVTWPLYHRLLSNGGDAADGGGVGGGGGGGAGFSDWYGEVEGHAVAGSALLRRYTQLESEGAGVGHAGVTMPASHWLPQAAAPTAAAAAIAKEASYFGTLALAPDISSDIVSMFRGGGGGGGGMLLAGQPSIGSRAADSAAAAALLSDGGGVDGDLVHEEDAVVEYRCLSWSECVKALWREVSVPEVEVDRLQQSTLPLLIFRGLRVRMGMHSGVAARQDITVNLAAGRVQYSGQPLKRARQVSDAARGGMVLCSGETFRSLPLHKLVDKALIVFSGDHLLLASSSALPASTLSVYQGVPASIHPRLVYLDGVRSATQLGKDTPSAPVGYVTICFMYVAGAQVLLQDLGIVAQQAMELFHAECYRQLMEVDGYLVEAADGFLLTAFHHPADALLWSLKCQHAMVDLPWPQELLTHELAEEMSVYVQKLSPVQESFTHNPTSSAIPPLHHWTSASLAPASSQPLCPVSEAPPPDMRFARPWMLADEPPEPLSPSSTHGNWNAAAALQPAQEGGDPSFGSVTTCPTRQTPLLSRPLPASRSMLALSSLASAPLPLPSRQPPAAGQPASSPLPSPPLSLSPAHSLQTSHSQVLSMGPANSLPIGQGLALSTSPAQSPHTSGSVALTASPPLSLHTSRAAQTQATHSQAQQLLTRFQPSAAAAPSGTTAPTAPAAQALLSRSLPSAVPLLSRSLPTATIRNALAISPSSSKLLSQYALYMTGGQYNVPADDHALSRSPSPLQSQRDPPASPPLQQQDGARPSRGSSSSSGRVKPASSALSQSPPRASGGLHLSTGVVQISPPASPAHPRRHPSPLQQQQPQQQYVLQPRASQQQQKQWPVMRESPFKSSSLHSDPEEQQHGDGGGGSLQAQGTGSSGLTLPHGPPVRSPPQTPSLRPLASLPSPYVPTWRQDVSGSLLLSASAEVPPVAAASVDEANQPFLFNSYCRSLPPSSNMLSQEATLMEFSRRTPNATSQLLSVALTATAVAASSAGATASALGIARTCRVPRHSRVSSTASLATAPRTSITNAQLFMYEAPPGDDVCDASSVSVGGGLRVKCRMEEVKKVVCRGLRLKAGCDVGLVSPEVSATTGRMVYRGRVMNRAARIASQATAGHVLTSSTVWDCAQTSRSVETFGICAASTGVFNLKGVREPVELFDCRLSDEAPS